MIYAPLKTFILFLSMAFISCTVEDSSSMQLGKIAKKHQKNSNMIIDRAMSDSQGYDRLGEMLDTFGPRLSGSSNLEKTLDWIIE